MKIASIETFFVSRFLVVRITTDDGTEGIGESCYWSYPKAAEQTVLALGEAIKGMDPADTEHIYNYLWRYNSSFRGNGIGGAISAIDTKPSTRPKARPTDLTMCRKRLSPSDFASVVLGGVPFSWANAVAARGPKAPKRKANSAALKQNNASRERNGRAG